MKDWWHKITIDWPCALGDWLWWALVVAPANFIDGLTRRRVLHVIGFVLLLIFFQQVVMFDLTFLFGLDLGLLMEVAAAIFVLSARDRGRALAHASWHAVKAVVRVIRRSRVRESVTKACRVLLPPKSDDDPVFARI
ncbi:MAG: hypothetical protein H0U98_03160 [Alphaproteobacteria bacterium]|nr:hypothetical protein [Alphaproteobacteria bacterium]